MVRRRSRPRRARRGGRPSPGRGAASGGPTVGRTRTVKRSNGGASPGRSTKWRMSPRTTPNRGGTAARISSYDPARGHQNSSASLGITQSAACSTAACRDIRVTHSAWRSTSASSRFTTTRSSCACLRRISEVPSVEPVVGDKHDVDAPSEVVSEPGVDEVRLVPDEQCHRDPHQGLRTTLRGDRPQTPLETRGRSRLERGDPRLQLVDPAAHPDEIGLTQHGGIDGKGAVVGRRRPCERQAACPPHPRERSASRSLHVLDEDARCEGLRPLLAPVPTSSSKTSALRPRSLSWNESAWYAAPGPATTSSPA